MIENIELPFCLYGCGKRVRLPNHKYIHLHINNVLKNRPVSAETRKKFLILVKEENLILDIIIVKNQRKKFQIH